ncbi:hypothetical protein E2C01_057056 [Portunus trituberculatus]|uniref:Uncharacterized protein n=1 Tax=Portunus trituberculatus TaxID=210409 RepID=A0A5B7H2A8_PORTR|nr:hypothetical protein [Portunus trituberculatus]
MACWADDVDGVVMTRQREACWSPGAGYYMLAHDLWMTCSVKSRGGCFGRFVYVVMNCMCREVREKKED